MKGFKYIARDAEGQRKEGLRRAYSSDDIANYLRDQGFTPISIIEASTGVKEKHFTRVRKIKSAELAAVCWQLNTMLEGGVQMATALETIDEDIENTRLQYVLKQVLTEMKAGKPFSEGLAAFPAVFNHLARAIVMAGETGGNLTQALQQLAEYYDNKDALAKKIRGAIAYPIFVFCFVVVVVIGIMTFIIPRFEIVFAQFGEGELPGFTRAYMAFYYAVRSNVLHILVTLLGLLLAGIIAYKTKPGHRFLSKMVLSLPIVGKVTKQAFIAVYCRTLSTLLGAGVPIVDVFDILCEMTANDIMRDSVEKARGNIIKGTNISLSLADAGFFPNMVVKMTQVGEEGGGLPKVLDKTAVYYERKVDVLITTAMALLEPVMIILVGAIVLVTVLAMYLPIFGRAM